MPRKNRACGACGHDPACGFASVYRNGVTTWLCHDDTHSCYVDAGTFFAMTAAVVIDLPCTFCGAVPHAETCRRDEFIAPAGVAAAEEAAYWARRAVRGEIQL